MLIRVVLTLTALYVLAAAAWIVNSGRIPANQETELLNVSYDPTRELWRDLNQRFISRYWADHGISITINQSHGSSTSQANAVINGLAADVVTLALRSDTDAICKAGLIANGWDNRLPNHSLPYYSTLVFVVRRGNPRNIHDWPDLIKPGVAIITPDPKLSGNGKLSFLAAWGAVRKGAIPQRGTSEDDARAFVTELYRHVPVLKSGARQATMTFGQENLGDVHLTWENEAHLEVAEAHGAMELIYPSMSIRAEPYVAWVDTNVQRHGTRATAEAYLRFLYTEEAQKIIAKHSYRPINEAVLLEHLDHLPRIDLFEVTAAAPGWDGAQEKFFAKGAIFDQIQNEISRH